MKDNIIILKFTFANNFISCNQHGFHPLICMYINARVLYLVIGARHLYSQEYC